MGSFDSQHGVVAPSTQALFGFRKWHLRGMRSRVVVHGIGMGSWKKMKIISLHQKGSARGLREPMKLVALLWQCLVFGLSDPKNDDTFRGQVCNGRRRAMHRESNSPSSGNSVPLTRDPAILVTVVLTVPAAKRPRTSGKLKARPTAALLSFQASGQGRAFGSFLGLPVGFCGMNKPRPRHRGPGAIHEGYRGD